MIETIKTSLYIADQVKEDKLEALLKLQENLNDMIFTKKEIKANDGSILSMKTFRKELKQGELGPNSNVNRWLKNFLTALNDESRELDDELLWKWWSKDSLDLQNIKVEIIDQLHFWLSLALVSGLTAENIFSIYCQKNEINIQRQNENYSKKTKNEEDNKLIKA